MSKCFARYELVNVRSNKASWSSCSGVYEISGKTELGYLKPWFVEGDDFRVVDQKKAALAIRKKACWICGNPFKQDEYALIGGPITAMARICREPPCHVECAVYAAQVCPFILYPKSKRRKAGLPEEATMEKRNEGRKIKQSGENPGEYYIVVVNNFAYDPKIKLMAYNETNVIERQYWIGGERQSEIPDPITPVEEIPKPLLEHYERSATADPV